MATHDALLPDPGTNRLLKAALAYAAIGWDVFPLVPRDKVPLTPNGLKDASHDPAQIRLWWQRHPQANIGGVTTGRLVIDVDRDPDPAKDGMIWHNGPGRDLLPDTVTQITGGGGLQYVYARSGGKVGNSAGKIAPGVDVRADGGYIVLPPSVHPSGEVYRWVDGASPRQRDPAPAPAALLALVTAPRELPVPAPTPLSAEIPPGLLRYALAGKAEGGRNDGAFWLACKLVEGVGTGYEARKVLGTYGYNCTPPLTEAELEKVWASAQRTTTYSPKLAPGPAYSAPAPVPAPPVSEEPTPAEPAIILSLLAQPADLWHVTPFLRPEHFSSGAYGEMYRGLVQLGHDGRTPDRVNLESVLRGWPSWAAVAPAWAALGHAPTEGTATADYAQTIYDAARLRALAPLGQRIAALAADRTRPTETVLAEAEGLLFGLTQGRTGYTSRTLAEAMWAYLEDLAARTPGTLPGLSTGYALLDQATGGLEGGDLIILAARPGRYKSAFLLDLHMNFAGRKRGPGVPTGLISLEMSRKQLAQRGLSNVARIDGAELRLGVVRPESDEWTRLQDANNQAGGWAPLYLHDPADSPAIQGLRDIQALARRWKAEHEIAALGIDYLGLIPEPTKNNESMPYTVGRITRGLKQLAGELNIPIILLSQLSRKVEERADHKPQLADLRDSGSIEQDADMVLFPWMPDEDDPTALRLLIAKQRNGPTDWEGIPLRVEPEYSHLAPVDPYRAYEGPSR